MRIIVLVVFLIFFLLDVLFKGVCIVRLRYMAPLLARCIYCGYATRSRTNDQPVCVACDKRILNREILTLHNGI